MRFKLDENLGTRTLSIFSDAGHDVETVRGEGLQGSTDLTLYDVCRSEARCLVTLDLDFSDVLRFPPYETSGIAVLRIPGNPTLHLLELLMDRFLRMLITHPIESSLWVVEPNRIRIHQPESENQ